MLRLKLEQMLFLCIYTVLYVYILFFILYCSLYYYFQFVTFIGFAMRVMQHGLSVPFLRILVSLQWSCRLGRMERRIT